MHFANYQPKNILFDVPDLGLSSYEQGLSLFIKQFFKDLSGCAAAYQFGRIRTPGISDIDLLIIVEDAEWKRSRQKAQSIINSSDLLKFLFIHEPVVVGISALESLKILHTLDNCSFLCGTWDPFGDMVMPRPDLETSLASHAVWNSFMRVAALEMNNTQIGLRRILVLIHNLLKSAKSGNRFISNPVPIPISSEEIRTHILSQPQQKQQSLVKKYITEIITVLNNVDTQIDAKLKFDSSNYSFHVAIGLGRYYLINFSTCIINFEGMLLDRLSKDICLVKVPAYLIGLASIISAEISNLVPALNRFNILNNQIADHGFEYFRYIQCLKNTVNICLEHDILDFYYLPLPFACQKFKPTLKSNIIGKIREKLLSKVLIFDLADHGSAVGTPV